MPQAKLPSKKGERINVEERVNEFIDLLHKGIQTWQNAGKLLCEMRKSVPGIYSEIIRREPMLSVDMLITIERIGRKELHPQLLLDSAMPMNRLIGFPYEEQGRLCRDPVDVVVNFVNGSPVIKKKMVRDMNRIEMNRALGEHGIRTINEQSKIHQGTKNDGNESWRALSTVAKTALRTTILDSEKSNTPPVTYQENTENIRFIGTWAVRQTIGNNCGFERTNTKTERKTRVMLDRDGIAVIEVCRIIN